MLDTDASRLSDTAVAAAIGRELGRQQHQIELIASENIVSRDVLIAQGSVLTNKYAEGYPGKRYYGGCEFVDEVETLAIDRVKELFGAAYANVQPHSGAQANQAVFLALLQPGDRIMGMSLAHGGHLTHGSPVTMSGKWFDVVDYQVREQDQLIDMDVVRQRALETKPKLILAGASAYPRAIDFAAFRAIADEVGAYLMVDMAHYAGLIAAGLYPNPVPHAHVVTSTTHKTLRGPRGGIILTNDEGLAKKLNSAVFPGNQGGPLMHVIAAKAVAFGEALLPVVPRLRRQRHRQRPRARRDAAGRRPRHRLGRHRLPHGARRPASEGGEGPRRRAGAGARRPHQQQERHPLRSGEALRHLGRPPRHLRRYHPRLRRGRVRHASASSS